MPSQVQDSLNNRPDPRMAIMDMNQTVDKVGNEMGYVDKVRESYNNAASARSERIIEEQSAFIGMHNRNRK